MKVTVFSDMKAENFLSMDIYAEQLVFALNNHKGYELKAQEFTVDLPVLPPTLHKFALAIGRYIKYPWQLQKFKGDINHVSDHSYGFLTYFLPRRSCVITCHDLAPLHMQVKSWRMRLKHLLWRIALRGTLRGTFIIADSNYTYRDILNYSKFPSERIKVIYPGLEERFKLFNGTVEQLDWERKFRINNNLSDAKIILHVGRYSPRKNFEAVLLAFAKAKTKLPENSLHLLQVGGRFTEQHFILMRELGISDYVTQIPFLPMDELPKVYNLASVLLFPSYYEGFGWPPLEAMACGTPVIASNVTSIPEVVGDAALLFAPDDIEGIAAALYELLNDKTLYSEMVARGRQRASQFTWEKCAQQVYEVYQTLYISNSNAKK